MIWANFLHIYQPPRQLDDIFERIANESYRVLLKGLKAHPKARLTLNVNAGLTEMLATKGYKDVIDDIVLMVKRGRLELTETSKYHAFLPLLPEREIERQIRLNHQTNKRHFGSVYKPRGFFPTEMAYDPKVAKVVKKLGYDWMIADEIAFNGRVGQVDFGKIYRVKGLGDFKIFFKEQRTSNLIANAVVRSASSLLREMGDERKRYRYLLTAMDGETFGHHRPGLEEMLFEIFDSEKFDKVLVSEIPNYFTASATINPLPSSWSTNEEDIKNGEPFRLWRQAKNPIHKLQWEFTYFVIDAVERMGKQSAEYQRTRALLDETLASDQYWWASKFWWSLEYIELGAFSLREVIRVSRSMPAATRARAEGYYNAILAQAFQWQRDGTIRTFHLTREPWQQVAFKDRTHPEWFNQMVLEFESQMRKATSRQEFELAIKWRDAIIKLKSGADVYDVLHVVNELHTVRKIPSAKPFLQQKRFSSFAQKHFLPLDKGQRKQNGKKRSGQRS